MPKNWRAGCQPSGVATAGGRRGERPPLPLPGAFRQHGRSRHQDKLPAALVTEPCVPWSPTPFRAAPRPADTRPPTPPGSSSWGTRPLPSPSPNAPPTPRSHARLQTPLPPAPLASDFVMFFKSNTHSGQTSLERCEVVKICLSPLQPLSPLTATKTLDQTESNSPRTPKADRSGPAGAGWGQVRAQTGDWQR